MKETYVRVCVGKEGRDSLTRLAKVLFQHPGTIARLLVLSQLGLSHDQGLLKKIKEQINKGKTNNENK